MEIMMLQLQVFVVSTRPERKGRMVADWFFEIARRSQDFESELVDLREVGLPLFDEPRHPSLQQYEHEHTRQWSKRIDRADAFVFVTPEYNYSAPPSLINALDFLVKEWGYKPAAFVSYGGVSGGTRSVQMSKLTLTALGVMPIPKAVSIPFFNQHIDQESDTFSPGERQEKAADGMLSELARWATALKTMRE
jgi:NAD(P)H-dependent FMN reductase